MDESINTTRGSPRSKLQILQQNLTFTKTPAVLRKNIRKTEPIETTSSSSITKDISTVSEKNVSLLTTIPDITLGNISALNSSNFDSTDDSILSKSQNIRTRLRRRKTNVVPPVRDNIDQESFVVPKGVALRSSNKTYDELGISLGGESDDSLDMSRAKEEIKKKQKRKAKAGKGWTNISDNVIAEEVENLKIENAEKELESQRSRLEGLDNSLASSMDETRQNISKVRMRARKSVNFSIDPIIQDVTSDMPYRKRSEATQEIDNNMNEIPSLTLSPEKKKETADTSLGLLEKERLERLSPKIINKVMNTTAGIASNISIDNVSYLSDVNENIDNSLNYKAGNLFKKKRKSVNFALDDVISDMWNTHKIKEVTNNEKSKEEDNLIDEEHMIQYSEVESPRKSSAETQKVLPLAESLEVLSRLFEESSENSNAEPIDNSMDTPRKSGIIKRLSDTFKKASVDTNQKSYTNSPINSSAEQVRKSPRTFKNSLVNLASHSVELESSIRSTGNNLQNENIGNEKSESPLKQIELEALSDSSPKKRKIDTPSKEFEVSFPKKQRLGSKKLSEVSNLDNSSTSSETLTEEFILFDQARVSPRKSTDEATSSNRVRVSPRKSTDKVNSPNRVRVSPRKSTEKSSSPDQIKISLRTSVSNLDNSSTSSETTEEFISVDQVRVSPRKSTDKATSSNRIRVSPRKSTDEANSPNQVRVSPRKSTEKNSSPNQIQISLRTPMNKQRISPRMLTDEFGSPNQSRVSSKKSTDESSIEERSPSPSKSPEEVQPVSKVGPSITSPILTAIQRISPRKSERAENSLRASVMSKKSIEELSSYKQRLDFDNLPEESIQERRSSPKKSVKESSSNSGVQMKRENILKVDSGKTSPPKLFTAKEVGHSKNVNRENTEQSLYREKQTASLSMRTSKEKYKRYSLSPAKIASPSNVKEKKSRSLNRKSSELSVFSDTSSSTVSEIDLHKDSIAAKSNLLSRKRTSVNINIDDVIFSMQKTYDTNQRLLSEQTEKSTTEKILYGKLTALGDTLNRESLSEGGPNNVDVEEGNDLYEEMQPENIQYENESDEGNKSSTEIFTSYRQIASPQKVAEMSKVSPKMLTRNFSESAEVLNSNSKVSPGISNESPKRSLGKSISSPKLSETLPSSSRSPKRIRLSSSLGTSPKMSENVTLNRSSQEQFSKKGKETLLKSTNKTVQNLQTSLHKSVISNSLQDLLSGNLSKSPPHQTSVKESDDRSPGPASSSLGPYISVNDEHIVSHEILNEKHIEGADESQESDRTPVAFFNKSQTNKSVTPSKKGPTPQISLHSKTLTNANISGKSLENSVNQTPNASKSLITGMSGSVPNASLKDTMRNKYVGNTSPSKSKGKAKDEAEPSTSRGTKKGSGDKTQLTLVQFLEKMSKNELPREEKIDYLAEMLKKPEILLKKTPIKSSSQKDKSPKPKKVSTPKLIKNLPQKLNCAVFQHFLKHKLSKEGSKALQDMTEIFFENLSNDLAVILASTKDKMINKNHIYMLMKQLKMVDCWEGMYSLLQDLLPSDEWKKVVPIQYAHNKVYPKDKK